MNEYQDDRFLARWLNGDLTEEEQIAFEQSEDYQNLSRVLAGVDQLAPQSFATEALLQQIKSRISIARASTPVRRLRPWYLAAAAVVLTLLAAWFFWPKRNLQTFVAQVGQQVPGTLPDASAFTLNAQSRLEFDAATWHQKRVVKLEGEAYFSVEKGETFTVETPLGSVRVLGTRFNVNAHNEVLSVVCFEGKVSVQGINQTKPQVLTPGQTLRISQQAQVKEDSVAIFQQALPGWMQGVSSFENVPLGEVIDAFARQFGVSFRLDKDIDQTDIVNASFPHSNLDTALKTAFEPTGIRWSKKSETVIQLRPE